MEQYTTGAGRNLSVHDGTKCKGKFCAIHNPSMKWPTHWRSDWGGFMEYTCPCGVGYPAPEDGNTKGHAYGTCGNPECASEYDKACKKVGAQKPSRGYMDLEDLVRELADIYEEHGNMKVEYSNQAGCFEFSEDAIDIVGGELSEKKMVIEASY